jgi:hypothetical protein
MQGLSLLKLLVHYSWHFVDIRLIENPIFKSIN